MEVEFEKEKDRFQRACEAKHKDLISEISKKGHQFREKVIATRKAIYPEEKKALVDLRKKLANIRDQTAQIDADIRTVTFDLNLSSSERKAKLKSLDLNKEGFWKQSLDAENMKSTLLRKIRNRLLPANLSIYNADRFAYVTLVNSDGQVFIHSNSSANTLPGVAVQFTLYDFDNYFRVLYKDDSKSSIYDQDKRISIQKYAAKSLHEACRALDLNTLKQNENVSDEWGIFYLLDYAPNVQRIEPASDTNSKQTVE